MKKWIVIALIAAFSTGTAFAAKDCEALALSKNGKPLAGAAKASFIKKCQKDAEAEKAAVCEANALSKEGKPLSGAAKNSSIKKCMSEAK